MAVSNLDEVLSMDRDDATICIETGEGIKELDALVHLRVR